MRILFKQAFGLVLLLSSMLMLAPVLAASQRITLSPHPQVAYYDVQRGDTLSGIAQKLLPANAVVRQQLMRRLVEVNPAAFINSNPNQLKANVRLWLPDEFSGLNHGKRPAHVKVEQFSWGYITRPVRQ